MRRKTRSKALSRTERSAQVRRHRALAHLERVRAEPVSARRPERRSSPLRVALLVLAGSLLAGFAMSDGWGARSTLHSLSIKGAVRLSPSDVATASGVAPGAPLAEIEAGAVIERLEAHHWIREARALPLPTGRLLLSVREREAVALLGGETPRAVDAEGAVFGAPPQQALAGLPRIIAPESVSTEELVEAVELLERVAAHELPAPLEVGLATADDDDGLSLVLSDFAPRVVLGRGDIDGKLARLAVLREAELPEVAGAARVDLRFADQVVLDRADDAPPPRGAAQAAASTGREEPSNERPTG